MNDQEAQFSRMDESNQADWRIIDAHFQAYRGDVTERVLHHLLRLKGDKHGYAIDRYTHCLQTATRALRDGADDETVVCALLHDIGDDLAPDNHADIAAGILEPFVDPLNVWMVRHHELFQGFHYRQFYGLDREARDQYRDHPAYARTVRFCDEWDQRSFDPHYDTLPLGHFRPLVERVLSRPPFGGHVSPSEDPAA